MPRLFGHIEVLVDTGASSSKDQLNGLFQIRKIRFPASLYPTGLADTVGQGNTHYTSVYWNQKNSMQISQAKQQAKHREKGRDAVIRTVSCLKVQTRASVLCARRKPRLLSAGWHGAGNSLEHGWITERWILHSQAQRRSLSCISTSSTSVII